MLLDCARVRIDARRRAKEKDLFLNMLIFENRLVSAGLSQSACRKTKFLERTLKRAVQPVPLFIFL